MKISKEVKEAALRLARRELANPVIRPLQADLDSLIILSALGDGDEACVAANTIHHIKSAEAAQRELWIMVGGPSR